MNAQSQEVIPASMSVAERAAHALSREETEAEILALVEQSKPIVAVTDNASRQTCHESLMILVNMRVLIAKRGKAGREEATQYSKAVIQIEKDLIALVTPEEARLAKLRDDFDAEKAREKEAKIQAELLRQKGHRENVAKLQNWCIVLTPASGSECINEWILDLESLVVDDAYEEFREQAEAAKSASLARLTALRDAALAHEEAQRKLEADRAELDRLRAEETERQRIAAEERTRQEALDKAARDAEALSLAEARAKQEAADKVARDAEKKRLADERAENERIAAERRAELNRQEAEANAALEAERRANSAEAARLAAEREVLEREAEERRLAEQRRIAAEQEALRKAQEPVPEVSLRQESALPAPLQAVPDLKEIPQDQGTSLDDKPLDGLVLAVLLARARFYVAHYVCDEPGDEDTREELLAEIDLALPESRPTPSSAVSSGHSEDWEQDGDLPF